MSEFKQKKMNLNKRICKECGFVYDPIYGDPESNIHPYTNFDEIPNDWKCPICESPKDSYELMNEKII